MNSFSLFRTNVALTSNLLIHFEADFIYSESFNSNQILSEDEYSGTLLNKESDISSAISSLWKDTPIDVIFDVKQKDDVDVVYSSAENQIDDFYFAGVNHNTNKNYNTDFEYFAPIYLGDLPDNFFIFRYEGMDNHSIDIIYKNSILVYAKDIKNNKFLQRTKSKIPSNSLEISFKENEQSIWRGFDCNNGLVKEEAKDLTNELNREMTFTMGYKLLTDNYKLNGVIYPNILNLKFGFNDNNLKRANKYYSLNRYFGFYINKKHIKGVSSFLPTRLINGIKVINNIFYKDGEKVDPIFRGFRNDINHWVEFGGNFYKIKNTQDGFKIISDTILPEDISLYNTNIITFDNNKIDVSLQQNKKYVIEILDEYYNCFYDGDFLNINSDFYLDSINNIFRKTLKENENEIQTQILSSDTPPIFNIYEVELLPIKDFDMDVIETNFANFEYDISTGIIDTMQPKMYEDDVSYVFKGELTQLPVSSEFISTGELFSEKLNDFLYKNIKINKWGLKYSNDNFDYPTLFNNSSFSGVDNMSVCIDTKTPKRQKRNLDYFYMFSDQDFIEDKTNSLILQQGDFSIEDYFQNGKKIKSSKFLEGTDVLPCQTYFKSIKFNIFEIDSFSDEITIKGTKKFKDYDFSIILSGKSHDIDNDFNPLSQTDDWKVIESFNKNKNYEDTIVLYNATNIEDSNGDMGFSGFIQSSISQGDFLVNDYTAPNGRVYSVSQAPIGTDNGLNLLYTYNNSTRTRFPSNALEVTAFFNIDREYLAYSPNNQINDIWEHVCIWRNKLYICKRNILPSDRITPDTRVLALDGNQILYWEEIPLYVTDGKFTDNQIVLSNGDIYKYDLTNNEVTLIYSFKPENRSYNKNDVIKWGNSYAIAKRNTKIENGINVYFNHRDKQVLVHIYSNDGLFGKIYNIKRDDIYISQNEKITANSFINDINRFINPKIKYYIIREGGFVSFNINNINEIPYYISIDTKDIISVYNKSLIRRNYEVLTNDIKIKKSLIRNEISSVNEVNYYNGEYLATTFERKDNFTFLNSFFNLNRISGYYDIVFKDIDIYGNAKTSSVIKSKYSREGILQIESDREKSRFLMNNEIGYFIDTIDVTKNIWSDGFLKRTELL